MGLVDNPTQDDLHGPSTAGGDHPLKSNVAGSASASKAVLMKAEVPSSDTNAIAGRAILENSQKSTRNQSRVSKTDDDRPVLPEKGEVSGREKQSQQKKKKRDSEKDRAEKSSREESKKTKKYTKEKRRRDSEGGELQFEKEISHVEQENPPGISDVASCTEILQIHEYLKVSP